VAIQGLPLSVNVGLGAVVDVIAAAPAEVALEDASVDATILERCMNEKRGGVLSSETNASGGTVWTAVGNIDQNDVAGAVNSGMYSGDVDIVSGVHGYADGTTKVDLSLYEADVARFGNLPGVTVHNLPEMSPVEINNLLNGPGTTIGAFCNSGVCLAPYSF
jgi:hypothetical protein